MRIYCDTCDEETPHRVIRKEKNLYSCNKCGTVREVREKKPREIKVIVSSGDRSTGGKVEFYDGDLVRVGDEIVVELPERVTIAEVTSIELKNGRRVQESDAGKIETIWTREVEEVVLKISLHRGRYTESVRIRVPGDEAFRVDGSLRISGKFCRITGIKTRNGRMLKSPAQEALAKEIVRVYAKYEG